MNFLKISEYFKQLGINRAVLTAYYYSDETNFSTPSYFRNGEEIQSLYGLAKELLTEEEYNNFTYNFDFESFYWDEIANLENEFGVFEINFDDLTITRVSDVYMPEAELAEEELEIKDVYKFNKENGTWELQTQADNYTCQVFDYNPYPPNKQGWLSKWREGYVDVSYSSKELEPAILFLRNRFVVDNDLRSKKSCRVVFGEEIVWSYDEKTAKEEQYNFPFYIKWADAFKYNDENKLYEYIPFQEAVFNNGEILGTNFKLLFNSMVDATWFLEDVLRADLMRTTHFKIENVNGDILRIFEAPGYISPTSINVKAVSLPIVTQNPFVNNDVRYGNFSLKTLSEKEILKLAEFIKAKNNWKEVVEFGKRWYGQDAYKIEIETNSEYDDEGGYINTVGEVFVYDKDDNLLDPQYSTEEVFNRYMNTAYNTDLKFRSVYPLMAWFVGEPSLSNESFVEWFEQRREEKCDEERYALPADNEIVFVDKPPTFEGFLPNNVYALSEETPVRTYKPEDIVRETYNFLTKKSFDVKNGVITRK